MRCAKSGQRVVILIDKNVKLILENIEKQYCCRGQAFDAELAVNNPEF